MKLFQSFKTNNGRLLASSALLFTVLSLSQANIVTAAECLSAQDATTCVAADGCIWRENRGKCVPNCKALASSDDCNAVEACRWREKRGRCRRKGRRRNKKPAVLDLEVGQKESELKNDGMATFLAGMIGMNAEDAMNVVQNEYTVEEGFIVAVCPGVGDQCFIKNYNEKRIKLMVDSNDIVTEIIIG